MQFRKLLKLSSLLLVAALAFVFLRDVRQFMKVCRTYGLEARLGPQQLGSLPVSAGESIVVLTGDRHRIPRALELLRHRGSPLLIITGVGRGITLTDLVNQQGDSTQNIHEVWKKIILESNSQSTIENATESGRILQKNKLTRVILVTSDYHMLRSLTIFRKVLPQLEIIPFPVASDFTSPPSRFSQRGFTGIWNFWIEYWKFLLYKFYFSESVTPMRN